MPSQMLAEILSIPDVVARQNAEMGSLYREIGHKLRGAGLRAAISNARGTSDHAATYLKYLMEIEIGLPLASVGPSVASVYGGTLRLDGQLCVTISQSGASTDLVMLQEAAAKADALTLALVNDVGSPIAQRAALLAPLHAGPEHAVAATKTFVASLVATATIIAAWSGNDALLAAIEALPDPLREAVSQDWSPALAAVGAASSIFTVSRGPGLAVAAEAALKFKESCRLHAEPFSAAELRHGPIALPGPDFAALLFAPRDKGRASIDEAEAALRRTGAAVFRCDVSDGDLPLVPAPHPLLDPICQIASFYRFVEQVAQKRGLDPDRPPHLSKVTVTQ
ncbi:Glucosamine-6-phosphate deaminase (isomerizing), alternative [Hyphomicrobiales bacterium]|nr:Glucosamine-6-phosphate deaminase (isomerizing), alternative [Hyphomicrobiales bacterium]CAH1702065.1 Glucosamine-6-phosphate deaminase (isomerizing), alternative [Hyphomicrobiales bacterium]CAI0346222.1 glutamine---fructose-6-phosphate transaminase (isomerizing) [Hyphomicrobiales bacterium]